MKIGEVLFVWLYFQFLNDGDFSFRSMFADITKVLLILPSKKYSDNLACFIASSDDFDSSFQNFAKKELVAKKKLKFFIDTRRLTDL